VGDDAKGIRDREESVTPSATDQFRIHGIDDWLHGMSWLSRLAQLRFTDECLLEKALWQAEIELLIGNLQRASLATIVSF
jgi:hypothetical protein